jgi:transposase
MTSRRDAHVVGNASRFERLTQLKPPGSAGGYLLMPAPDTECFQIFLETLAKKYPKDFILLFVDGAGNHHSDELEIPTNIILHLLPPYSPELNPQENLWDEIREKIFKNYALKSMDDVTKLDEAAFYIERNPTLVRSITSFPYIAKSL